VTSAVFAASPKLGSEPLSDAELALLRDPLELTLYKYVGDMDPALALLIAAGMVVTGRVLATKMRAAASGYQPSKSPESSPAPAPSP